MPRRHRFQHVEYARGMRPSALRLDRALIAAGYAGPSISWGLHGSNKRLQLATMQEAGVPTPQLLTPEQAYAYTSTSMAVVGRTDQHRAGQGFWLCYTRGDIIDACDQGATHFMPYLHPAREFRCHIVHNESIKLTEKIPRRDSQGAAQTTHPVIRSFENGWVHHYPHEFGHRVTLRRNAKAAVEALGLTHGAVDMLWHDDMVFVLEVNNAPALTSANDTLDRYVAAFMRST